MVRCRVPGTETCLVFFKYVMIFEEIAESKIKNGCKQLAKTTENGDWSIVFGLTGIATTFKDRSNNTLKP